MRADLRAIQLSGDDAGNIALRDAGLVEVLANLDHLGDRCVFDQVGNGFHVLLLSRRRRRHIVSTSIQIFNLKTDAVGCSPQHRARQDHSRQRPIPVPRDTPALAAMRSILALLVSTRAVYVLPFRARARVSAKRKAKQYRLLALLI